MKVFIAGATGVIGQRAVPLMVAAGHSVTAMGRSPEGRSALQRVGAAVVSIDLFDRAAVERAINGHEVVVNLATHIPSSPARLLLPWSWKENDRVRREGSNILVHAALLAGATRFIQESFAPIYPDCGDLWITERTAVQPARFNRTVVDAEHATERFAALGRTAVVLRFGSLYGPDAFMQDMIKMVKMGWAALPGRPSSYFSSISQRDAASAVVAALDVPSGIYNVSDDEPLRRRDYFDSLADVLGVKPPKFPPAWTAPFMGVTGECMSRSQRISNAKLRSSTEWAPLFPSVRQGWPAVLYELRSEANSVPKAA